MQSIKNNQNQYVGIETNALIMLAAVMGIVAVAILVFALIAG